MAIQKNIGITGRIARIIVGVIAISMIPLAFFGSTTSWAYLGVLGIIPLIFGISGYCPRYALLGINTHRKEKIVNQ